MTDIERRQLETFGCLVTSVPFIKLAFVGDWGAKVFPRKPPGHVLKQVGISYLTFQEQVSQVWTG